MEGEATISPINAILFLLIFLGAIIAYLRPVKNHYQNQNGWDRWAFSLADILLILFLAVVLLILAPFAGMTLVDLIKEEGTNYDQYVSIGATFLMQVGLVAIILGFVHKRGWSIIGFFRQDGLPFWPAFCQSMHLFLRYLPLVWLTAVFWGMLLWGIQQLGIGIQPAPQVAAEWIANAESVGYMFTLGLMVVIGAPISEELVFRGFLYRFLREIGPARLSLIVSSILFSLIHANLQNFLPLCMIGLLLAKVYEDTKDIRTPILFHAFFNLFSFLNLIALPQDL
ncbi:MAG: CPBP family intramembrane glutamic endopeptidase [Verrucomicrobiota bacterium]